MISVQGKRIFLSGPMSDDPTTYHAHDFIDAHVKLKNLGAEDVYDPAIKWLEYKGPELSHWQWMKRCICELCRDHPIGLIMNGVDVGGSYYDMLVSLPGWRDSYGARVEMTVATALDIECRELSEVCE